MAAMAPKTRANTKLRPPELGAAAALRMKRRKGRGRQRQQTHDVQSITRDQQLKCEDARGARLGTDTGLALRCAAISSPA